MVCLRVQVGVTLPTVGGFPQDEDIATAILGDPQGLGFFGVAFASQNVNGLSVIPLAGNVTESGGWFFPLFFFFFEEGEQSST